MEKYTSALALADGPSETAPAAMREAQGRAVGAADDALGRVRDEAADASDGDAGRSGLFDQRAFAPGRDGKQQLSVAAAGQARRESGSAAR